MHRMRKRISLRIPRLGCCLLRKAKRTKGAARLSLIHIFSQLITKLDLVEAVAEYDSKLLNDLSEQAKSIKVLYDEIEDRKNMKQSELEEQAEAEAELISKKSELQTTLTTLMADEEELEAQEQDVYKRQDKILREIEKSGEDGEQ